jgi:hypothetical protein
MRKVVIAKYLDTIDAVISKDKYKARSEVFKNPNSSDYLSFLKDGCENLRFIAVPENKSFYIFDAKLLHFTVLNNVPELKNKKNMFLGTGVISRGKLTIGVMYDSENDGVPRDKNEQRYAQNFIEHMLSHESAKATFGKIPEWMLVYVNKGYLKEEKRDDLLRESVKHLDTNHVDPNPRSPLSDYRSRNKK